MSTSLIPQYSFPEALREGQPPSNSRCVTLHNITCKRMVLLRVVAPAWGAARLAERCACNALRSPSCTLLLIQGMAQPRGTSSVWHRGQDRPRSTPFSPARGTPQFRGHPFTHTQNVRHWKRPQKIISSRTGDNTARGAAPPLRHGQQHSPQDTQPSGRTSPPSAPLTPRGPARWHPQGCFPQ